MKTEAMAYDHMKSGACVTVPLFSPHLCWLHNRWNYACLYLARSSKW